MVPHATEPEAEKEAKRLARANTGRSFFVLRAVSRFELDSLRETILELPPPF
jgi:hypothetical protein